MKIEINQNTFFNKQPFVENLDDEEIVISNEYIKIEITKYIKAFAKLENVNNPGFLLKVKEGNIKVITADSYFYPAIIEIIKNN